jgi:hypothetical protein
MGPTMLPGEGRRWAPLLAGGALVGALALLGVALPAATPADASPPAEAVTSRGMVHTVSLLDAGPAIPDGPNWPQFQAYCRLCHSPRMVLTQPRMSQEKWAGVVSKMVKTYGAPIPSDQEPALVEYLTAVRGPVSSSR